MRLKYISPKQFGKLELSHINAFVAHYKVITWSYISSESLKTGLIC